MQTEFIVDVLLALVSAVVMSFAATPVVKVFAEKVGAIDDPNRDDRRVHDHPIPRMGGLAIFLGFILSVVLFVDITKQIQGILLGAVILVTIGAIDDVVDLKYWLKFMFQFLAAMIAVWHGVVVEAVMNPNVFSASPVIELGILAVPLTVFWILAITNAVNFIDGLDGLAVGVSTIDSVAMFFIALLVAEDNAAEGNVAVMLAALAGACIGFMPYNLNPAKIFMGDTGALLLGYLLSTVSVIGLFKFYAIISFAVPYLVLGVPALDITFAFFRRLLKGQNPMKPDMKHFHHRLIAMGLSQKHAVAILYCVSAVLALSAVLLATENYSKALILLLAFFAGGLIGSFIMRDKLKNNGNGEHK